MRKLLTALATFGVYFAAHRYGVDDVLRAVIVTVVVGVILTLTGLVIADRQPTVAAALISAWNVVVLLSLAVAAATVALVAASIADQEPEKAPTNTAVLFALGAAVFAAVSEWLSDWGEKLSMTWITKRFLCPRYSARYPTQPAAPPEAVNAYRTVRDTCQVEKVSYRGLRNLLAAIE